jgi:hypothetical protein
MKQRKLKTIRQERAGCTHFFMSSKKFVHIFGGLLVGEDDTKKYHIAKLGWRELNKL